MSKPSELRFAWWNVQDFAHFDPAKASERRWPLTADEYAAKCRLIDAAFDSMFGTDPPDVIGLCEITEVAARELQQRKFAGHTLIHPGLQAGAEHQIAVLYRSGGPLLELTPVTATDVPRTTRQMPVVQWRTGSARIRFIFCHWTPFDEPNPKEYRGKLADAVRQYVYDYIHPTRPAISTAHVVVVGDLNTEPFDELFVTRLQAHRDRASATGRRHSSDGEVRRVRLYNCGWRYLGERFPHSASAIPVHTTGTFFGEHGWKTYDQVLVSGGLLTSSSPYLDESALGVLTPPGLLDAEGRPIKFELRNGQPHGLSDHLPVTGRIALA